MLLLARKYTHIYERIYTSGIQTLGKSFDAYFKCDWMLN
jgi:hypothetical protein